MTMGFVVTYIPGSGMALYCLQSKDNKTKPCMFKEMKTMLVAPLQTSAGDQQ
jgi:hypothetical protein